MTITDMFVKLGAPLANIRTSWGAVRSDGVVFLRVWQLEEKRIDGVFCTAVVNWAHRTAGLSSQGYAERDKHLELIRNGAKCYLIICMAPPGEMSGSVADFLSEHVFEAGELIDHDGITWLQRIRKVPVAEVLPTVAR